MKLLISFIINVLLMQYLIHKISIKTIMDINNNNKAFNLLGFQEYDNKNSTNHIGMEIVNETIIHRYKHLE